MAKRQKVKPINLDKAVDAVLSQYGDDVSKVLDQCVKDVSEEATNKLKSVVSFAPGGQPSGEYSASWINESLPSGRLNTKQVVHNEEHYRLTHLLEKGHVIKDGTGRVIGHAGAYPHIAPVNDWANEELPKRVEQELSRL